jgi:hypothetical protein
VIAMVEQAHAAGANRQGLASSPASRLAGWATSHATGKRLIATALSLRTPPRH